MQAAHPQRPLTAKKIRTARSQTPDPARLLRKFCVSGCKLRAKFLMWMSERCVLFQTLTTCHGLLCHGPLAGNIIPCPYRTATQDTSICLVRAYLPTSQAYSGG